MERRDQYAAIDQGDMDRRFERRRMRGFGLGAVLQRTGRADELDAGADPRDMPGQPVRVKSCRKSASSRAASRSIWA